MPLLAAVAVSGPGPWWRLGTALFYLAMLLVFGLLAAAGMERRE